SRAPVIEAGAKQLGIELFSLSLGGNVRSQWRDKALRANVLQVSRRTRGLPECERIVGDDATAFVAASTGDRFINADGPALRTRGAGDHCRYVRLADAGVVAGNEKPDGCTHFGMYATMIGSSC